MKSHGKRSVDLRQEFLRATIMTVLGILVFDSLIFFLFVPRFPPQSE